MTLYHIFMGWLIFNEIMALIFVLPVACLALASSEPEQEQ